MSDEQYDMNNKRDLRDHRGLSPRQRPSRGSYAEQRIQELKEEREKYNVNDLGYYRGGVPRINRGALRGDATGRAGEWHSPAMHNYRHFSHPDSYRVTADDAVKFKHFMGTDRADFERTKPAHPMYYDNDHNYKKDRTYWLHALIGLGVCCYGMARFHLE